MRLVNISGGPEEGPNCPHVSQADFRIATLLPFPEQLGLLA